MKKNGLFLDETTVKFKIHVSRRGGYTHFMVYMGCLLPGCCYACFPKKITII